MIKKIIQYILISTLFFLPFVSFASFQVGTTHPSQGGVTNKTATSATLWGDLYPQGYPGGSTIPPLLAGISYKETKTNNDSNCDVSFFNGTEYIPYGPFNGNAKFFREATGLKPNTKYYYCASAYSNEANTLKKFGYYQEFKTEPKITLSASKTSIRSGEGVVLKWVIEGNPTTNCIALDGWSGNKNSLGGTELIQNIKQPTVFRIKCINELGEYGESEVKVLVDGEDNIKSGTVKTLPHKDAGGGEPEVVVNVTDKSATLKGKLETYKVENPEHCKNGQKDETLKETGVDIGGECKGLYGYFRISKVTIPPIFCNDIFGSNMIAVTATNQGSERIAGGKLNDIGEFSGTIYTLEPDTDYAYCAIVSNHPTTPTEIEYGGVVRFRTNPCVNCPHTTVRTIRPAQVSSESAILQGNYNSTRNIKVWFEYRQKWGGQDTPTNDNGGQNQDDQNHCNNGIKDGNETGVDTGGDCGTQGQGQTFLEKNLKNRLFGINNYESIDFGLNLINHYVKKETVNAANDQTFTNEWHILKDSETVYNKKRNYGRKQFTLTGLSRDTVYQYKIVAETIVDKTLYPNPNPRQRFEGAIVEFRTKIVNDGVNPFGHCSNGIQDFGETGVDIGGGCPGKAPSCDDGVQNGDETGIDQGGSCKDNSLDHCLNGIQDFGETGVDEGGDCDPFAPECPEGEICECPPGSTLIDNQCIPNALPTCNDGIQNGDETGIDTGGSCDGASDPSCVDGIQNQDETGIDTGGVCGEVAPDHCFNGVQDEDETGIDKGGSCGNDPRPNRCKNGIQDGDETGIDTGGRCGDKVVVEIKATSYYIPKGGRTTVKWTSTNADYCVIPGYRNGAQIETKGEFSPINITEKQRTYTATCTSAKYGTGSDSITIFTYDPANSDFVSVDIKAKPTYLVKKGNVDITWTSKNAASCIAHGPVLEGKTGLEGAFGLPGITKSSTWSVDCIGKKGDRASDSEFVFVDQSDNTFAHCFNNVQDADETGVDTGGSCGNTNDDRVTVDIKASPEVVIKGNGTVISWTSKNATSCVITDYKNGKSVEPNSSGFGVKLESSKSYTATCKGINDGVASDTVKVLVFPPTLFVTVDVKAEKSTINQGDETEISWTSTNATSCTSSGGGGTGTSGSFKTGPLTKGKTYNVTCKGGASVVPNSDSVFVSIKTSTNNDDGDDGNGEDCGEGWVEQNGNCIPTYTCPTSSTGIWPNCKYIIKPTPCPTAKGWSGEKWPDCKYTNPPEPCPKTEGWTGTNWPNCKYNGITVPTGNGGNGTYTGPCPKSNGWSGTNWPNCKYTGPAIPCPKTAGWTGVNWPDCKYNGNSVGGGTGNGGNYTGPCPTATGWTGVNWPDCKYNGINIGDGGTTSFECPRGWTGVWPKCTFIKECPSGTTGEYPDCKINNDGNDGNNDGNGNNGNGNNGNGGTDGNCPVGYTGNPPTCTATTTCPAGWTGIWPTCTYGGNGNNGNGNNGNDNNGNPTTCPNGTTGTWPTCTFTQTCPAGYTGVWPVCTSGPTTNIAHCSNGVQDFGETAIDIGGGCGGVYNSGATCFDNIKNGDETGIDEGGHCGDGPNNNGEYPSCFDNIKNGDETGIDSGGHCGNPNNGTDWVDVIFPDANGNGTTTGTCVNGECTGTWNGNFPGLDGPFSGSCRAGTYTDCTFTGTCVNGECTGTWNGNFPGQNGPFIGTINGGLGDGRGLENNDWIDTVFTGLSGEGNLNGECLNGICKGKWKGVAFNKDGPIAGVWSSPNGTGPFVGECKENVCSGTWSGVIPGNNGKLIGKWKGDGIGKDDGKELYIGYEGIPDVDDIVRYHEGIEHVFIRRIMINTELARHYGYQKGQNLLQFAWELAHTFAKEFGYVNSEGNEIRVSQPDVSAYQLRLVGNKLTVYEYYKNKIIDIRERTTVFKNKNSYEYYFEKP